MKRSLVPGVVVLTLLLIVLDAFCLWKLGVAGRSCRSLGESYRLVMLSRDVYRYVLEAEAGERAFLLSGREQCLAPCYAAMDELEVALLEIEASPIGQTNEAREMRYASRKKMIRLVEAVARRRAGASPPDAEAGVALTAGLRRHADTIQEAHEARVGREYAAVDSSLSLLSAMRTVHAVAAVVLAGLLAAAYRRGE